MIRFQYPTCGQKIKVPDDSAGKSGKCKCGEHVKIPKIRSLTKYPCPFCGKNIDAAITALEQEEAADASAAEERNRQLQAVAPDDVKPSADVNSVRGKP